MNQLDWITRASNRHSARWIAAYYRALCDGRRVTLMGDLG